MKSASTSKVASARFQRGLSLDRFENHPRLAQISLREFNSAIEFQNGIVEKNTGWYQGLEKWLKRRSTCRKEPGLESTSYMIYPTIEPILDEISGRLTWKFFSAPGAEEGNMAFRGRFTFCSLHLTFNRKLLHRLRGVLRLAELKIRNTRQRQWLRQNWRIWFGKRGSLLLVSTHVSKEDNKLKIWYCTGEYLAETRVSHDITWRNVALSFSEYAVQQWVAKPMEISQTTD
jgi:hypothetical protein